MMFTLSLGWWLAPAAVTIGTFAIARRTDRRAGSGLDLIVFPAIHYCVVCIAPSLAAWLLWALL